MLTKYGGFKMHGCNNVVNLEKLSIGWVDEIVARNNELIMSVISFDKEIKIICDGIISLKVDHPDSLKNWSNDDIGNIVDVSHEYRLLDSKQCFDYYYNDYNNTPLNIIRLEGDYTINIICRSVFFTSEFN